MEEMKFVKVFFGVAVILMLLGSSGVVNGFFIVGATHETAAGANTLKISRRILLFGNVEEIHHPHHHHHHHHRIKNSDHLIYGTTKRKVPNGPDPIHNRRAGNSHQPPGQA
ncbi:hypothetical protein ACJIZ3_025600 [Penstemon smallii]|uniref:Uncharacterized protein n=1 Tax=Penstemon smallii TaxID=265156 RepID=A0ABD3TV35_9LAMI